MADKTLNVIRNTFLKYFEKNDHRVVDSSNIVPNNDPTLMFANSGMVQFKMYLHVWKKEITLELQRHKNVLERGENIMI